MSESKGKPGAEVERAAVNADVQRRFADMAMMLPQSDGDGASRIVDALLSAANPFDLNTPWETESSKSLAGKIVQVNDLTVQPSDFTDGLGIFLVVHSTDLGTGEPLTFTTGSISVVAQLVRAYVGGWLPLVAEIVQSERATKDGYRPIRLRVISAGSQVGKGRQGAPGAADDVAADESAKVGA